MKDDKKALVKRIGGRLWILEQSLARCFHWWAQRISHLQSSHELAKIGAKWCHQVISDSSPACYLKKAAKLVSNSIQTWWNTLRLKGFQVLHERPPPCVFWSLTLLFPRLAGWAAGILGRGQSWMFGLGQWAGERTLKELLYWGWLQFSLCLCCSRCSRVGGWCFHLSVCVRMLCCSSLLRHAMLCKPRCYLLCHVLCYTLCCSYGRRL